METKHDKGLNTFLLSLFVWYLNAHKMQKKNIYQIKMIWYMVIEVKNGGAVSVYRLLHFYGTSEIEAETSSLHTFFVSFHLC